MLGNDLYKVEVKNELSNERLKSLVFFYAPLVGSDALYLYQYLSLRGPNISFIELNELLNSLNISIDKFEKQCEKLNEYKLLKTLRKDNKYIFILNNPLTRIEFTKDDIFVRDFILKTSGPHYQEICSDIYSDDAHVDFEDVSKKLSSDVIDNWSANDETYLKKNKSNKKYNFNTLFDINIFLKDISTNLLPMRFRTEKNLKEIATLADLYNISYDKMRDFLPSVARDEEDSLDLSLLRYKCMAAHTNYQTVENGNYDVPCIIFLMNKQNGKEVTDYDKKVLRTLSEKYNLSTSVINALIEYTLNKYDNRLHQEFLYSNAADLHRNNITNAKDALNRLRNAYNTSSGKKSVTTLPKYEYSKTEKLSREEIENELKKAGKL